jgi:protein involved in polysaccharide export with SLBB domain
MVRQPHAPAPRVGPGRSRTLFSLLALSAATLAAGCQELPRLFVDQATPGAELSPPGEFAGPCSTWQEAYRQVCRIEPADVVKLNLLATKPGTKDQTSIRGAYPVKEDGAVDMGQHGRVYLGGMTLAAAHRALTHHFGRTFPNPKISLDVEQRNGKYYYLFTEDKSGTKAARMALGKDDKPLDAIAKVRGLSQRHEADVWIIRPASDPSASEQTLPVDLDAITSGTHATNYDLKPGDRVFVARRELAGGNRPRATISGGANKNHPASGL